MMQRLKDALRRVVLKQVLTGMVGERVAAQAIWWAGVIGSVTAALLAGVTVDGHPLLLPDPWNSYLQMVLVVTAAVSGYAIKHPPPRVWTANERARYQELGAAPPDAPPRPPRTAADEARVH